MFAAPGHTRMISHYCRQHVSDRLDKSITNVPNMYLVRHKDSLATLAPRGTHPHPFPRQYHQVVLTKFISLSRSLLFTPGPHRRFAQVSDLFVVRLDALLEADILLCTNVTTELFSPTTAGIILVFSNLCAHLFKLGEIYRCRSRVCCKPVLI